MLLMNSLKSLSKRLVWMYQVIHLS